MTGPIEETLGGEFWIQPEGSLSEPFSLLYAQLAQVLREEARQRSSSALDYPIIERIAYMYAYLRQRESGLTADDYPTDRNRREMNKDWIELATAMKKMWASEDKDNSREIVLKKFNTALNSALEELPDTPDTRALKSSLVMSFDAAGL